MAKPVPQSFTLPAWHLADFHSALLHPFNWIYEMLPTQTASLLERCRRVSPHHPNRLSQHPANFAHLSGSLPPLVPLQIQLMRMARSVMHMAYDVNSLHANFHFSQNLARA